MNLGLIDVEGGCFTIYIPWLGRGNGQSSPRTEVRGLLCRKWGKGKVVMKFWLPAAAFRWPPQLSCGKGGW